MASNMDKLAKELKKEMSASDERKPKPYDTQAEVVRVVDGTAWVHIPGGVEETPVRLTIDAKKGDTVNVHVANGTAWITGNSTRPPTDDTTANHAVNLSNIVQRNVVVLENVVANNLEATNAKFENVEADTAKIHNLTADQLNATVGYIGDLTAGNVTAQNIVADHTTVGSLDATYATISSLTADEARITAVEADTAKIHNLTANELSAATGYIGSLTAGNVTAADIIADHATVDSLDVNYAHITNGVIDNAEIDYADVNNLDAHYAEIDLANVNNAWIQNGIVKDAAITDAQIIGVSANKLTAGTIDASNITVTNLNASNITTGSITVDGITIDVTNNEASIDGAYIEDGTITMNGLDQSVKDVIDGAIETFTGTVVPTLNNAPASSWTTTALKDQHIGDVYYVVNSQSQQNGYCYRFTKSGNTYSWQLIKDSDVTAALSRLTTVEGEIGDIQTFDQTMATFKTETEGAISTLQTKTTSLETSLGDKVDTTTFNELSQTVDGNSSTITTLSTIASNNGLTTSTNITNTVNSVSQTANTNSSKISSLTQTLGTNADGTTKDGDIVHQVSQIDQDLSSITTRVGKTEVQIKGSYAICDTSGGTAAKVAVITPNADTWELYTGATITVKFTNANTAATPTLKVIGKSSGTGTAKTIKAYTGTAALSEAEYKWPAGATMSFVYDGSYWRIQDSTELTRIKTAETSITQTATSIESLASNTTTYTKPDGTTGTNSMASAISQNASNITLKVSKDNVIAEINASTETSGGSAVKISANKVNIEGAAIFTSGRLSQTSLNNAYDANGAAATAKSEAISTASADATSKANAAESNAKGYTDTVTSDMATNTGVSNTYATKAAAVAEEQRIYYRSKVNTKPNGNGLPTTWVTDTVDKYNSNATTSTTSTTGWSRKITPVASSTSATSNDKYLYLWTCIQKKTVSGTVTYGDILLDETTTIIDGGTIVTGTLNANTIGAGDIAADRMKANSITAINSLTTGKINAARLNVGQITVGDLSDGSSYSTTSQMNTAISTAVNNVEVDMQSNIDDAATKATNYITNIDSNTGIRIHPSSTQNNSVVINADGMEIFKGGTGEDNSVAFYGDVARIGPIDSAHLFLAGSSIQAIDSNGNSYFEIDETGGSSRYKYRKVAESMTSDAYSIDLSTVTGWSSYSGTFTVSTTYYGKQGNFTTIIGTVEGTTYTKGTARTTTYSSYDGSNTVTSTAAYPTLEPGVTFSSKVIFIEWTDYVDRPVYRFGEDVARSGGANSFLMGRGTKADGPNALAIGMYNKDMYSSDTVYSAFMVGKGTSDSARKNLFQVDCSGNIGHAIVDSDGFFLVGDYPVGIPYFTCDTAAATAAKVATLVGGSFGLKYFTAGAQVLVKFTNANGVASPTLQLDNYAAKPIMRYGSTKPSTSAASSWNAGAIVLFVYDGTNWVMVDWQNTTYSGMTDAEVTAGTGTSNRLITPARLKTAIQTWCGADYVIAQSSSSTSYGDGYWRWREWNSGKVEIWYHGSMTLNSDTSSSNGVYRREKWFNFPNSYSLNRCSVIVDGMNGGGWCGCGGVQNSSSVAAEPYRKFEVMAYRINQAPDESQMINVYICGEKAT